MDKVGVELGGWRHKWEKMSKVVYAAGLALPSQETETFREHPKNTLGILSPTSRPPNLARYNPDS